MARFERNVIQYFNLLLKASFQCLIVFFMQELTGQSILFSMHCPRAIAKIRWNMDASSPRLLNWGNGKKLIIPRIGRWLWLYTSNQDLGHTRIMVFTNAGHNKKCTPKNLDIVIFFQILQKGLPITWCFDVAVVVQGKKVQRHGR